VRAEAKAAIACAVGALLWFLPWLLPGRALLGTHPALFRPYEECVTPAELSELKAAAHPQYSDKLLQHDPEVRFGSRDGALPAWDPWVLGGVPHVAQGLASPLYPLLAIARIVPPPRCYALIAALQTALAAWFAWRMARAFGVRPAGAGAAALLFAASGWMSVHQEYFQLTAAATWLPLAIGSAKRLLDRKGGLVPLALAVGCAFLSGFPQIAVYVVLAPALLAVATAATRLARKEERGGDVARHAGRFALALAAGLALASPQLLATAEFVPWSTRQIFTPEQVAERALAPAGVAGALLPDLFVPSYTQAGYEQELARAKTEQRSPWIDTLWARALLGSLRPERLVNRFETTFAIGPAALLLALLGLAHGRHGARGFFAALLAAGLALALQSPLLPLLSRLPGLNIGDPKRALLLVATALAGLAALGVEAIVERPAARRGALALHAIVAAALLAAAGAARWLVPLDALRGFAAPRIAADLGVATEVIAGALRDPLIEQQRDHLVRALLGAAAWTVAAGAAIGWFARSLAIAAAATSWRAKLAHGAVMVALALPLGALWLDATRPIPTAKLDAQPALVQQVAAQSPSGRLVRLGAHDEMPPWPPKLPMVAGVRDAQGYVAAYVRPWQELFAALEPGCAPTVAVLPLAEPRTLERPLIDLLDVEYAVAARPVGSDAPTIAGWERSAIEPAPRANGGYELALWRNREPFGRARVVDTVRVVERDAEVIAALVDDAFEPTRVAFTTRALAAALLADARWRPVAGSTPDAPTLRFDDGGSAGAATRGAVALLHDSSDELRFFVSGRGGLLVQTDCWYPGWIAAVDGQPAELLRVDHALRGVVVPAGDHEVLLRYVPRRLQLGLVVAASAAMLLLALLALQFRRAAPGEVRRTR